MPENKQRQIPTAYAVALKHFKEDPDFESLTNVETLGKGKDSSTAYLTNRLEFAFAQGWNARGERHAELAADLEKAMSRVVLRGFEEGN